VKAPSSFDALVDALGNAALRREISWQAADRIIRLAEISASHLEAERERRGWLDYAERVRGLTPVGLTDDELERESQLALAWLLKFPEAGWLEQWQTGLAQQMRIRWGSAA